MFIRGHYYLFIFRLTLWENEYGELVEVEFEVNPLEVIVFLIIFLLCMLSIS